MGNKQGSQSGGKFDVASIKPNPKIGALLKKVPLLAKFTAAERAKLGGAVEPQAFKDGEAIIKEGDMGHGFYILMQGTCSVTRLNAETKEQMSVGSLQAGDYFGEAALINDSRRGATVAAHGGEVKCLYLGREAFTALFAAERLHVQFAKRTAISAEVNAVQRPSVVAPVNAVREKTPEQRKLIFSAVQGNLLFEGLSTDHKNMIVDQMWRTEVKQGVSVIEQGDRGDNLYIVESGNFDVFVKTGSTSRKVASRGKGTCFGELALMYNAPRAATVTSMEDSQTWVVDRFSFRRILANVSDATIHEYEDFLKKVDLLAPLSTRERAKVAEALEEVTFSKGEVLAKQGDQGDCMFILKKGQVRCTIDEEEVKVYKPGEYFGERSLIKDEPRAATLTATTDVEALQLDRAAFSLLLGPLEDIMGKQLGVYQQWSESKLAMQSATTEAEPEKADVAREDLKIIGTLGKGSFGHVQLVKDPKTNKTYALKAVSKQQIVQTGQQGHIMSEKKVMAMFNHPFLIRLWNTYKDRDRLYFLLEPSMGGELFSVLRRRTFFDENTARFYASQVILAFEYMHSKNIIYRDLKPENLLLDDVGYLKVTDFGFAKIVTGRTYTLCGTPDYLAPEIVAGKGHGKGVDWWTLGILIYEMLSSYPPFYDEDPMKTYAKIMHGKITFPSHFSKEAVNIIQRLLHHKPTKRLGVVKGGAKLIKEHEWFTSAGFDWDKLYNKKLPAPIIPKIANPEDLSNFDDYPDDEAVPKYVDNGTDWDAEF